MVGVDNYADFNRDGKYHRDTGIMKLQIVSDFAKKADKLATFTETGQESNPDTTWWTRTLLKAVKVKKKRLTHVLVWRNDKTSPIHFVYPFRARPAKPIF